MIQAELRTYVTPIVVLPPEESIDNETAIENLIDTSDTGSFTGDQLDSTNTRNGSISPDALAERYRIYMSIFLLSISAFFLFFYINWKADKIAYIYIHTFFYI